MAKAGKAFWLLLSSPCLQTHLNQSECPGQVWTSLREKEDLPVSSVRIHSNVGKCESSAQCPAPKIYFHISMVKAGTSRLCLSEEISLARVSPQGRQTQASKFAQTTVNQSARLIGLETGPRSGEVGPTQEGAPSTGFLEPAKARAA